MKPDVWYIDADNSAVENVKKIDNETWLERFVDRLAEEFKPDEEQLEMYYENKRNLRRKLPLYYGANAG